jgi:hypothetical protein
MEIEEQIGVYFLCFQYTMKQGMGIFAFHESFVLCLLFCLCKAAPLSSVEVYN